jgi:hypothetical protein
MNLKPQSKIPTRPRPKLARTQVEGDRQRRMECFRVLAAIAALLPSIADTNGRAVGTLGVAELSSVASVSRKATSRALRHWQRWRVLWLYWKGHRVWDVRFERAVVEAILAAKDNSPQELGRLLTEHRRQREAVAPRNSRKTPVEVAPAV